MLKIQFNTAASATIQYTFLTNVFQMISLTDSLVKELKNYKMGLTDCDTMLMRCEQMISGYDFSTLTRHGIGASLFKEDVLAWFNYAIGVITGCITRITDCSEIMMEIPKQEADDMAKLLVSGKGALAYSALQGMGILASLEDGSFDPVITASEGITAVVQDRFEGDYKRMIFNLYECYTDSPPFVPVRLEFPEKWNEFIEVVEDTECGKEILDYGDSMFLPDVKGIIDGKIDIDDNLLGVLQRRAEDEYHPSKLFPFQFSEFLNALPDKYEDILFKYEQVLSEDLMREGIVSNFSQSWYNKLESAPQLSVKYKNSFVYRIGGAI